MKKETIFMIVMTLTGMSLGLTLFNVLMNIAMPFFDNYLLTVNEYESHAATEELFAVWLFKWEFSLVVSGIFFIALLFSLFPVLNPRASLGHSKKCFLAVFIYIIALSWGVMPFWRIDAGAPEQPILFFLKLSILYVIAWYLLRKIDLSVMTADSDGESGRPNSKIWTPVILGSAFALANTCLFYLIFSISDNSYKLISEVFDGSSETSYLGFKYLGWAIMLISGVSAFIIGCFTVALTPAIKESSFRKKWLTTAVSLLILFAVISFGYYRYASKTYDLDKKNLADAVGAPEKSETEARTVCVLGLETEKIKVIKWPLELEYLAYGIGDPGSIEVSPATIEKLKKYQVSHPNGSIFQYTNQDALFNSYLRLWDFENSSLLQIKQAPDFLLRRMTLLARLQVMPVTNSGREILESFTDENRYYVYKNAAIRIAKAFIHFGENDKAKKWLGKAREEGADEAKLQEIKIPQQPQLTTGEIAGNLKIGGKTPKNTKIALLGFQKNRTLNSISTSTFAIHLVDGMSLGQGGEFTFNNIGKGSYVLALMTESSIISYDIEPNRIIVNNSPGTIELNKENSVVDLGSIEINIK